MNPSCRNATTALVAVLLLLASRILVGAQAIITDESVTCSTLSEKATCAKHGDECLWARRACWDIPDSCSEAPNRKVCNAIDDCAFNTTTLECADALGDEIIEIPGTTVPSSITIASGDSFSMKIPANTTRTLRISKLEYRIPMNTDVPSGLNINKRTGEITWQPDINQVGKYNITVEVAILNNAQVSPKRMSIDVVVKRARKNPSGLYVDPKRGDDDKGDGSSQSPFKSIRYAAEKAKPGNTIYVRGGKYNIRENNPDKMPTTVIADGDPEKPIVITHLPGEHVVFTCANVLFYIPENSKGVTIRGFEMDGETDKNNHWDILKTSWWIGPDWEKNIEGCRKAVEVDGEHVTLENNLIHDFRQKAVNIVKGRYVTVRHNIVWNIGHHSISGGHGIMRQWESNFGKDNSKYYRWDIYGNLLFAIEQRIYSNRLRSGSFAYLRLDEGKSILIDKTKDKKMKARCSHNLILYGGLEAIRLKGNSNVEVEHNTVLQVKDRVRLVPDGITVDDDDPLPGMILKNNLVHSYFHDKYNQGHAFGMWDNFKDKDFPKRINDNYCSGGGIVYKGPVKGIEDLGKQKSVLKKLIFNRAEAEDFEPSGDVPKDAGVDNDILQHLFKMVKKHGIKVSKTGWKHNHYKNIQTILKSAPKSQVKGKYKIKKSKEKDHKDLDAYWFKVKKGSELHKACKCKEVELIPDEDYWAEYRKRRSAFFMRGSDGLHEAVSAAENDFYVAANFHSNNRTLMP